MWDGAVWKEASLADLGLILHLGHQGHACAKDDYSQILVGDLNGFVTVNVHYQTYPDSPASPSRGQQLLAAGLFPCSDYSPKSAFTLPLLDMYNILTTLGRTSGHKYYTALERVTKPGFPGDVKDRYRELMNTHRRFLHILNLQLSGQGFELHPTDVHPGDQALDCVGCPRPGINFEWAEILLIERYVCLVVSSLRSNPHVSPANGFACSEAMTATSAVCGK